MRIQSKAQNRNRFDVNMAPLIDMVFILLIFFMVTTSFQKEEGVEINRPSLRSSKKIANSDLLISVDASSRIFIEDRELSLISLVSAIQTVLSQNPNASVIIVADTHSSSGQLLRVYDECKRSGAKQVSIAAKREEVAL